MELVVGVYLTVHILVLHGSSHLCLGHLLLDAVCLAPLDLDVSLPGVCCCVPALRFYSIIYPDNSNENHFIKESLTSQS